MDCACCKISSDTDYLVCTCMGIMHSDLCQAVCDGADTMQKLADELMVTTGCSSCVPEIEEILVRHGTGDQSD